MEKGMEKGKGQGKIEILTSLLKKKLNALPRYYEEKLFQSTEEVIAKIAEDIFDIKDVKDLDTYSEELT